MMTTLSTKYSKKISRIIRIIKSSKHKQESKNVSVEMGSGFLTQNRSQRKKGVDTDIGGQAKQKTKEN